MMKGEDDDDWEELEETVFPQREIKWPPGVEVIMPGDRKEIVPESPAEQWQQLVEKRKQSKILIGRVIVTMVTTVAAFGAGATIGVAFAVGSLGPVGLTGLAFLIIVIYLVILGFVWLVDD